MSKLPFYRVCNNCDTYRADRPDGKDCPRCGSKTKPAYMADEFDKDSMTRIDESGDKVKMVQYGETA